MEEDSREDKPSVAMAAISEEVLTNLAKQYQTVKLVLCQNEPNVNGDDLDEDFEEALHKNLQLLEELLLKSASEEQDELIPGRQVLILMTRQSILDEIITLLIRAAKNVSKEKDIKLGPLISQMRTEYGKLVSELRSEITSRDQQVASLERDKQELREALEITEGNCDRLVESTAALNIEAEEQNDIMRNLKDQLEVTKELAAKTMVKDRNRKSFMGQSTVAALQSGAKLVDKPAAIVLNNGVSLAGIHALGGTMQGGELQSQNGGLGVGSVLTAAALDAHQKNLAAAIGNKTIGSFAHSGPQEKNVNRADSGLLWLKRYRSEVQAREDENVVSKKILTLSNCLATIKHIYKEKSKFETKVANVKAQQRAKKEGGSIGATTRGAFSERALSESGLSITTYDGANSVAPTDAGTSVAPSSSNGLGFDGAAPPQETLERFVYRMLDKRFGYRKLSVDHAATLQASLHEYAPLYAEVAVFRAVFLREVDEHFPKIIDSLEDTISNLIMTSIQVAHPNRRHEYYEAQFQRKTQATENSNISDRLVQHEWMDILEYLYNENDVQDITRRLLETSVSKDLEIGIINETEAAAKLEPPKNRLKQPSHRGSLGYKRAPEPEGRLKPPKPHSVPYYMLKNVCCMYQLERQIRLMHPVRDMFDTFDLDHDGILNRKEFAAFLKEVSARSAQMKGRVKYDMHGKRTDKGTPNSKVQSTMVTGNKKTDQKTTKLETVFDFVMDDATSVKSGGGTVQVHAQSIEKQRDFGPISREVAKLVNVYDPYRVDRITFTTACKAYYDKMPKNYVAPVASVPKSSMFEPAESLLKR
jgi:hypothetical protein